MKISNKIIFITGGAGFIGSWLCKNLIDNNEIIIYDNCRRNALKFLDIKKHKNLTLINGDICNKRLLSLSIPRDVNIVLHLAAIAGVSSYYQIPLKTMETNLIGTYNLLQTFKKKPIEVFIDFSTSEVYGRYAKYVREEEGNLQCDILDMRWTYAISKFAAEKLCHCYRLEYNLPVISIRPFNIYGPRQVGEGAVQIFILEALRDKNIFIDGDGSQVRAWCYIEDFIEGVIKCIIKRNVAIGNIFNLGNPDAALSTLELAKKIIKISNSKSKIFFRRSLRTDVEYRIPDISKAKKILGFLPKIDLNKGLKRTIEWYRKNPI